MVDREKVIQGLGRISEWLFQQYQVVYDGKAPNYYDAYKTVEEAIELLKEQEPVKSTVKVVESLENCVAVPKCRDCPWEDCEEFVRHINMPESLAKAALELLKWQKPISPIMTANCHGIIYNCSACGALLATVTDTVSADYVRKSVRYCQRCSKAVKWND